MKACRIIVTGRVQKAGYRNMVAQIAADLDINGCVRNLGDKSVEIIAEHENESALREFIERIRICKGLVKVKDTRVEGIEPRNLQHFDIIRGDKQDEILESMDFGAGYLSDISNKQDLTIQEIKKVGDKQDLTIQEIKKVGNKQDLTIQEIRGVSEEQRKTTNEIKKTRGDFRKYPDEKFSRLENEVEKIKVKLHMA